MRGWRNELFKLSAHVQCVLKSLKRVKGQLKGSRERVERPTDPDLKSHDKNPSLKAANPFRANSLNSSFSLSKGRGLEGGV